MFKTVQTIGLAAAIMLWGALSAQADVVRIPEASFVAGSGLITFSEFPNATVNPTYLPAIYGGGPGSPTVTFDGFFAGQSLGGAVCGGAATACVIGSPTGPLALSAASPDVFVTNDAATPTSPVLSGTPTFNGPITMLFSVDMAGVGLLGGFFDAIGGTAIRAFDRNGNLLGQVTNSGTGIEFLGLVTEDGSAQIAGLQFSLVGNEPAGFAIDNLRFGAAGQVVVPTVPEPATLPLLGVGLAGLVAIVRRKMSN
jgi:hypothetical protein